MKIVGIWLLILLLSPIFIIESYSQDETEVIIGKDSVTSNYDYHATGFNPQNK